MLDIRNPLVNRSFKVIHANLLHHIRNSHCRYKEMKLTSSIEEKWGVCDRGCQAGSLRYKIDLEHVHADLSREDQTKYNYHVLAWHRTQKDFALSIWPLVSTLRASR